MVNEGHTVASLTAGIEGSARDEVIDRFRSGEAKVLITTNVLARGIDISTVSMVINYVSVMFLSCLYYILTSTSSKQDVPVIQVPGAPRVADFQTYLHRIGRTGRFGRVGVAITFVSDRREWAELAEIQNYFHTHIQRIDASDWDEVERVIKKTIKNPRAKNAWA